MHPALESDFQHQRVLISRLIFERQQLPDGTPAAQETDRLIAAVRELICSYETFRRYEKMT